MSVTAPQGQPTPGQDPQEPAATVPAPTAPAPAAPAGTGPWANDLAALFPDEAERGRVDGFIRSKVQPYTTTLEQRVAESQDATRLWSNLNDNPIDTYVAMTTEMFGEDAGQVMLQQLQSVLNSEAPQGQAPTQQQQAAAVTDPRVEAALQYIETQQNEQHYENEMKRVTDDPNNAGIDPDLLHPFVAAAGGDFDQAVALYKGYAEKFTATANPDLNLPAPTTTTPAPPVMGSDAGGAAPVTPPVQPQKQTLDEAINDFMTEQRANREAPPVV